MAISAVSFGVRRDRFETGVGETAGGSKWRKWICANELGDMARNGPEKALESIDPPLGGGSSLKSVSGCDSSAYVEAPSLFDAFKSEAHRDSEAPSDYVTSRCRTCEVYDLMGFGQMCPCTHVDGRCTTPVQP